MEMNPGKHCFMDDFLVESITGARRVLNHPEKLTVDQPLQISLEEPWEKGNARPGGVIFDEKNQIFRMYYQAWGGGKSMLCALNSTDGVNWEHPNIGLVDFNGSKENNITNCPPGFILWDAHETDEDYRWKRIDNAPSGAGPDGRRIWQALHSRDGYHWKHYPPGPHNDQKMMFNFGSPPETFGGTIDPDARYVYYSQRGSSRRTRVLGRRDSPDFLNWSGLRTVIDQDLDDPPGTEFYSASFDINNRTDGGLHIMMLQAFLTDVAEPYAIEEPGDYWGREKGPSAIAARIDGVVDVQLAVSRDTVSWKRYREPLILRGKPGAWDWGMLYADAPILHDGKLWFFYNGRNLTHNGHSARLFDKSYSAERQGGKGLATLRPDGYVSVEAISYAPGILTTHRFRQESGGTVGVNVDASAGELRYEVVEDTGAPIPGFTVADCDPIRCDTLDGTLSWNRVRGWPGVSEEKRAEFPNLSVNEFHVKLRFYISPGTKLYSMTLDPPEVTVWGRKVKGRID